MAVIEVQALGKTYPGGTQALEGVSFEVPKGEVFCLLGRNGAGKTTLLRILATQLRPTTGHATVLGHDVTKEARAIREKISVVPQEARPQMMLSAYDHIYLMSMIRGIPRAEARRRTRAIMEEFDLWEHKDKLTADLSGGLRQRVMVAIALTTDPELLFLDEPTIGLDPLGRRQVWAMVRRMTRQGVTVLLTTHYMDEAERLSDRLAIVDKGRTVFLGSVEAAKAHAGHGMQVIIEALNNGGERQVLSPNSDQEIVQIVQRGIQDGKRVTFKPPTLEDAFIAMVGGNIDDESA
ncbi:MAG TPA: ABC transporter ATP-binding protein [Thermoplasmata archaeon]|nr:ABC transporter ATP-binding protein [Thermoplasmata archaeon]